MSPYRKRILLYVLGSIMLVFIILTAMVSAFPESVIDAEFSEEVQEYQHPLLDAFMKGVSLFGTFPYSMIMALITSLLFLLFGFKKEALYLCLTLTSGLVSTSLKILVNRPRPTEDVVRIIEETKRQSFPSGHVLFYVMFFGFLTLLMYHLKKLPTALRLVVGCISLFFIFTVPFSRIYLGAHWFTDVVGGFLMGMLCLLILSYFYLRKPN